MAHGVPRFASVPATKPRIDRFVLPWAILIGLCAIAARIPPDFDVHNTLWAEDGKIFLDGAEQSGWMTIVTPYAGYFLFFPRLMSAVAVQFPLIDQPVVLFVGWLAAYLVMVVVVVRAMAEQKLFTRGWIVFTIAAISLQPANGEVFFTITNAQWMLGTALAVCVLMPVAHPRSGDYAFLILAGLTGPFVLIVLPIAFAMKLHGREATLSWRALTLLGVCFGVQATSIVFSDRIARGGPVDSPGAFFPVIVQFLRICQTRTELLVFPAFFWAALLGGIAWAARGDRVDQRRTKVAIALIAMALIFFLAALFSERGHVASMTPFEYGNRYTWIPFALLFVAFATALSRVRRFALFLAAPIVFGLCAPPFHRYRLTDVHFNSFAHYAAYRPVRIPIAPLTDGQGHAFYFDRGLQSNHESLLPVIELDSAQLRDLWEAASVSAANESLKLPLARISCAAGRDVMVDVVINAGQSRTLTIFWSDRPQRQPALSFKLFQGVHDDQMNFAFKVPLDPTQLWLASDRAIDPNDLQRVTVTCL